MAILEIMVSKDIKAIADEAQMLANLVWQHKGLRRTAAGQRIRNMARQAAQAQTVADAWDALEQAQDCAARIW